MDCSLERHPEPTRLTDPILKDYIRALIRTIRLNEECLEAHNVNNTAIFDEAAQDAVGGALVDTVTINFTYNDVTNTITADFVGTTSDVPEGTNLYFTDERAQDAVGGILTDTSSVDFTYNDAGNLITADLTLTGVAPGTYGTASAVGTFTVDAQGRLSFAVDTPILITSGQVSDFVEAAQDAVGATLLDTATIDLTYNDGLNTISADFIGDTDDVPEGANLYFTDERAQDAVGNILTDTATIDFTYNDAGNTISAILTNTTVAAGTYGSATQVGQFTVDAQGRLTFAGNVTILTGFANGLLHIQDEKAQNTDGGTFTNGAWRTRDLNTVKTNEISGASLATNQITLPAGTYWCQFSAPAFENAVTNAHQARLFNVTDSTVLITGKSCGTVLKAQTDSFGWGRFTLASSKVLELQHQIKNTQTVNGFGTAANFTTEVYSVINIWKL